MSRSVDLAFQGVQVPLLQGLSAKTNLAGKLVKDITDRKTPDTRQELYHVIDSVALLSNTNWKLNMRRRELINPDLNLTLNFNKYSQKGFSVPIYKYICQLYLTS